MSLCATCIGGPERCTRDGHLRSRDVTTYSDNRRRWFCDRCGTTYDGAPLCERCGDDVVAPMGPISVMEPKVPA